MDSAPLPGVSPQLHWRATYLVPLAVFLAAFLVAGVSYARFRTIAHELWNNPLHDRNAHYWLSLSMGLDLRQGHLLHFLRDLDKTRVWGPLYPLLTGAVLAIGGPDYRLAVLGSLAAWCCTVLLGFLVARRAVLQMGNLAGFLAALFILASPAHRAFACDVMLESLGACLSLLAIYCYLVLIQDGHPRSGRSLALSLTFLFFLKYNYWLLVGLSLLVAELFSRGRVHSAFVRRLLHGSRQRLDLRAELHNPLNWGVVAALLLVGLLNVSSGILVQVGGTRISVRSPDNLIWLAYVLGFARAVQWWVRSGRADVQQLDPQVRDLVLWHLWPAALWMLWPKRLAHFFWYLTRDHGEGEASGGLLDSVAYYFGELASHYHQHLGLFVFVLVLCGVAFVCCRRLRVGAGGIVALALIAGLLTVAHPTCRSRFLHSWIAILWVLAGAGLAAILAFLPQIRSGVRNGLAAGLVVTLAIFQGRELFQLTHTLEAGIDRRTPTTLLLSEQYLPDLAGSDKVAILSNQPVKFFSWWTYLQRYRKADRVDPDLSCLGEPPTGSPGEVEAWLRRLKCDAIVLMEFAPHSRHFVHPVESHHESLRRCLTQQSVYLPVRHLRVAEHDCEIVVYRRGTGLGVPAHTARGEKSR